MITIIGAAQSSKNNPKPKSILWIEEDIELDDDVEITDPVYKGWKADEPEKVRQSSKPKIAGVFLLVAFFLNLIVPITWMYMIYDAETATGETSLIGQVLDIDDEPLANVTVTILDTELVTTTDTDGKYKFETVPVGPQIIEFSKQGYQTVTVHKILFSKGLLGLISQSENELDIPGYLQNNEYVEAFEAPINKTVIFEDNLNGTIYGVVTNISGEPISNAQIEIVNTNLSTITNSMGYYLLNKVTPGIITITAQTIDELINFKTNVTILFAYNRSTELNIIYNTTSNQQLDQVTGKTGSINGTILTPPNEPAGEAIKIILNTDPLKYPHNEIIINTTGSFKFDNVPVGLYDISIVGQNYRTIKIYNITVNTDQLSSIPAQELDELEPIDEYVEDISGAYICTVLLIIIAIITLLGAISAFQRKRYSIAFMGAMLGILPFFIQVRLDICLASIFCLVGLVIIVFSRNEFSFDKA